MQPIAQDAAAALGDGWHESDSLSTQYLQFCQTVHNTASDFLMSKLLPDQINKLRSTDAYQESGTRYATSYLNKLLPLNGHVRAFMAGMGMKDENIRPGMLSMAAHVTSIGGLLSPEGLAYPIGGPRAVCKALEAVILQSGGKVVSNAIIKELVF
jgi:phytoene dehydrogenase-like protein